MSAKVLQIKSETEASLRNSSSLVSLVGNIARILGVFLRIDRSTHSSNKFKKKLEIVLKRESSLLLALNKRDTLEAEQSTELSPITEMKQTVKFGRGKKIRVKKRVPKVQTSLDLENKKDGYNGEIFSSGETDSSDSDESSCEEKEENRKDKKKIFCNYSDAKIRAPPTTIRKELGLKDHDHDTKNETEKLRLKIKTYLEERNRLEKHLNASEEERKTLYSDAIVVRKCCTHLCVLQF